MPSDLKDIGESWEISAVPGSESVVAEGPLKGLSVTELTQKYGPDFLGTEVYEKYPLGFPLLVKLIDAKADLSVQVHPGDSLASMRHNSLGKTEVWYIIDSLPGAKIYSGLKARLSPESYKKRIAENSIMEVVGVYDSAPGQFYYVPAGTIHSIGAGNLVVEVQQTSDITYRVYDHDRRDAQGRPRELHTELAVDAIDYSYPNNVSPTAEVFNATTEGIVISPYFKIDYLHLDGDDSFRVNTARRTFAVIMVIEGKLVLRRDSDGKEYAYAHGSTVLLPASVPEFTLCGSAKALLITVP